MACKFLEVFSTFSSLKCSQVEANPNFSWLYLLQQGNKKLAGHKMLTGAALTELQICDLDLWIAVSLKVMHKTFHHLSR
jgi:hypothetical protein